MELYKENLIHKIEDDLAGRNKNWEALENHIKNISDEYDPAKTYQIGDYAIYENTLYRCISVTNGEWDSSAWVATSVAAEIVAHKAETVSQEFSQNPHGIPIYEEGTWIPDLRFGSENAGMTYSVRDGYYIRIGNMVIVTCRLVLASKGTSTGSARIIGLPYPVSASIVQYFPIVATEHITISDCVNIIGRISPGETSIRIRKQRSDGAILNINDTDFMNNSNLFFTFIYTIGNA